eukprot:6207169-Pleurochrysis_carterae.AAC.2
MTSTYSKVVRQYDGSNMTSTYNMTMTGQCTKGTGGSKTSAGGSKSRCGLASQTQKHLNEASLSWDASWL